jgi:ABC-type antimicrobial peptide transport system permease subunit
MAVLTVAMGSLALLLAAVGMYGVLAFLVAARRQEIGLRMAVGASRGRVVALILRQVSRLAVHGILSGALLTWLALRLLAGRLTTLHTGPLWLYALPPIAIALAALGAAMMPAQRAASVNPIEALRTE